MTNFIKISIFLLVFGLFSVQIDAKSITLKATAYALRGKTKSGKPVKRGYIAADLKKFPLGTKIKIIAGQYTGVYVVEDSGSDIKGNRIDIWLPSKKECQQFGVKAVKAFIM